MSSISQKEYLKKYLGIGKAPGEKKKKKKKTVGNRLKIIDDDADVISQGIQEDISAANEDAPQIVAVIDERPPSMRIDEETKSNLWKPIGATEDTNENKTLKLSTSFNLGKHVKGGSSNNIQSSSKLKFNQQVTKSDYSTIRIKEEKDMSPKRSEDSDMTPPRRKRGNDCTPPRIKIERDISSQKQSDSLSRRSNTPGNSPRRRDDDNSPLRRRDGDSSPPRRRDDDSSPPRRRSDNISPPRRDHKEQSSSSRKYNSDFSPPRKRGGDQSPPRKRQSEDSRNDKGDRDVSPRRRNEPKSRRSITPDNSPPRRTRDISPPRKKDNDNSPPRKNHQEQISSRRYDSAYSPKRKREEDLSPPRKKITEENYFNARKNDKDRHSSRSRKEEDSSPPRRMYRDDNSPRRKRDEDTPPSKRKVNDLSPPRRTNKEKDSFSRTEDSNDTSPPRRRYHKEASPNRRDKERSGKRKDKESRWGDWSPDTPSTSSPKPDKMKKTLDGKKAGLQNARDLIEETTILKRKEDEIFKNMSAQVSGRNAATVVRNKKTDRDPEEEAQKLERERKTKEKYDRWGKGVKQMEDQSERIAEQLHEMSKPLARYADDEDLERYLKEQEREGDPMLSYIRKKRKKEAVAAGAPEKPTYMGEFMPNRFGIRPGYRWDGVDRSNGYEKKWFQVQNAKKASQEDAFKWSTEDM